MKKNQREKKSQLKKKFRRKNDGVLYALYSIHSSGRFSMQEAVRRATLRDRYKRHRRLLVPKFRCPFSLSFHYISVFFIGFFNRPRLNLYFPIHFLCLFLSWRSFHFSLTYSHFPPTNRRETPQDNNGKLRNLRPNF